MARYRGGDGHYADVECAYAEFKRRLVLNALRVGNHTQRSAFKVWLRGLTRAPLERFAGHHEAREALVLSVASVTAIMLTAYLLLLIFY